MNHHLQQLLEYPHEVIRAHIMLAGCGQHGAFNKDCYECDQCHDKDSCEWIKQFESEMLENFSEEKKVVYLEHALDSMMSYVRIAEHNVNACTCYNCVWISKAMSAYNDMLISADTNDSIPHP